LNFSRLLQAKSRRPARLSVEPSRKTFFSFLEEFFGGARKSEIVKKVFLRGRPPLTAAGGGQQFLLK
jgi:hypothetical protein